MSRFKLKAIQRFKSDTSFTLKTGPVFLADSNITSNTERLTPQASARNATCASPTKRRTFEGIRAGGEAGTG